MTPPDSHLRAAQQAFHDEFVPAHRGRVRVLATDVDGTLTDPHGLLRPVGLEALAHLRRLPQPPAVVLVTGRPAASVQGLLLYTGFGHCPIVAENGAVVLPHPGAAATVRVPFREPYAERVTAYLTRAGIRAQLTSDNADRLSDITFVPEGRPPTPEALAQLAMEMEEALRAAPPEADLPATRILYSTVHVHVGAATADKGEAMRALLAGEPPFLAEAPVAPDACVLLGDSGNDAAMFTAFPQHAVAIPGPGPALHPGLADVARYAAPAPADEGFAAVVHALFPNPGTTPDPC